MEKKKGKMNGGKGERRERGSVKRGFPTQDSGLDPPMHLFGLTKT